MLSNPKPTKKGKRKKHGKSIMQKEDDWQRCFLCMAGGDYQKRSGLETHHVMFGAGRRSKSEEDGLTVRLCHDHHEFVHKFDTVRKSLSADGQRAWEAENMRKYGEAVRQRWLERYGKSYIDEGY